MGAGPDSQGRVAYARRRKRDRPVCPVCGTPYRCEHTAGPVSYYYPRCRCRVPNRKVFRERVYYGSTQIAAG